MNRRLVHLITSLGGGGTENFLFQIVSGSPAGFTHEVFYLRKDGVNGDRIRALGIPVAKVKSLYSFYQFLKKNPPAVLHTCLYWGNQVGRILGRAAQVPFILSSHQSIDVWQSPWHGWIDRWTLPLCNAVDVNSDAAQQVLEKRLRHAAKKPAFVKVSNGVDFKRFQLQNRHEARKALGIPDDAVVGGTLMRLHAEKGAEKIPAVSRTLLTANPKLILLVGGTGREEARLKNETRDLDGRLRWLGWQEDTVNFLSALDFFWLLSREESFPQALLEASAMGLPWMAPDVGGVHELVQNGACGILCGSGKPEEITRAGQTLLTELSQRRVKAQEAIPMLHSRYSVEKMTETFYRIINKNDL